PHTLPFPTRRSSDLDVLRHVVAYQPEPGPRLERRDVVRRPGDEVVHADDLPALSQEELAEVGADEPRAARDQRPHRGGQAGRTRSEEHTSELQSPDH